MKPYQLAEGGTPTSSVEWDVKAYNTIPYPYQKILIGFMKISQVTLVVAKGIRTPGLDPLARHAPVSS